jgi:aryl-alcohol dehydrogenase-like predicted oxidoreductase
MAWVLRRPGITSPIVGATKPHHLDDAIAGEVLKLTDEEASRLEELYRPHPATEAFS